MPDTGPAQVDRTDVEVIDTVFQLFAEGGPDAVLARYEEFFHDDFEWHPALIGGLDGRIYRGRTGFEQYWRDFTDAFQQIDAGRPEWEVVWPGRLLTTATIHVVGTGGGVPIDQEASYVFDLRDGKVVQGRTFFSRAEAEEFARA